MGERRPRLDWEGANRRDRRARAQQSDQKPLGRNVYPPTQRQLELLRELCADLGRPYVAARTGKQASARIRDLLAAKRRMKPKQ